MSAASSSPISASAPSTHTPSGGSAVQPAASSSSASHSKFSFATQQKVGPAETSRKHEKERDGEGLTGGARKKGLSEERQGKKRKGEKKVFEKSVEAFISPHHSSSGEAYIRKKRGRANRTVSSLIRSWFKGGNGRDLEDRQDDRKAEEGCHCEEDLPPEIASSQKRGGDASLPSSSASSSSFSSSFSASPVSSSSPSTANERGGEHQSHAKNKSEATAAHVLAPPKQERVEYVTALSELVSFQPTPVDEGKLLYAFSLNIEIESAVAFLYREEETERRRRRLSRKRSFNKLSVEQVQTHRPSVEEEEEEEEKKKRREEIKEDRQERKTDQQVMEESGLDQIAEEVRRSQGAQTRRKHIHSRDEGPEARVSRPEVVDKAIGGTLSQSEEVERDKRKGATSLWRGEENKEVDEEEEEGQGENSDVGLSQVGEDKRTGVEARGELGEERENQAVLGVESDGPEKEAKRRRDVLETRVSRSLSFARSPPRAPERVVIGSLLLHGGGSRGRWLASPLYTYAYQEDFRDGERERESERPAVAKQPSPLPCSNSYTKCMPAGTTDLPTSVFFVGGCLYTGRESHTYTGRVGEMTVVTEHCMPCGLLFRGRPIPRFKPSSWSVSCEPYEPSANSVFVCLYTRMHGHRLVYLHRSAFTSLSTETEAQTNLRLISLHTLPV